MTIFCRKTFDLCKPITFPIEQPSSQADSKMNVGVLHRLSIAATVSCITLTAWENETATHRILSQVAVSGHRDDDNLARWNLRH